MNYKKDGVDHINIYSKSETKLGKMLSNFYHFEFDTDYGIFQSIEGYWYYVGINTSDDNKNILKTLYGFQAKQVGKELKKKYGDRIELDFEKKIFTCIYTKVLANKHLLNENNINLPLTHYYKYKDKIVDVSNRYDWLINGISKIVKYVYTKHCCSN